MELLRKIVWSHSSLGSRNACQFDGLRGRPILRIAAGAVTEAVDPALGQVAIGIGLHVDGDVLVHRGPQLGRLEVAVVRLWTREIQRAGFGVGELDLREATFLGLLGGGHLIPLISARVKQEGGFSSDYLKRGLVNLS